METHLAESGVDSTLITMSTRGEPIPNEPKPLHYYAGVVSLWAGVVLVLSTFVTGLSQVGSFEVYGGPTKSEVIRAIVGIVAFLAGAVAIRSGAKP